ncbi:MAG: peptidase, partial [Caulobacterales bacterium]|nr:peptidase [Caulobacterales bacterium]
VLVGDTTCGKPYGFYPQDNCGETYYTIQFQGVNDKGFGDYADGFAPETSNAVFPVKIPGCLVSDDLANELGDESEALLAAALAYRETGSCPAGGAALTTAAAAIRAGPAGLVGGEPSPAEDILRNGRDMRMPY